MRKLLDDLGIKCLSTHNGFQAISAEDLPKAIELNQDHRQQIHHHRQPAESQRVDGWKKFADQLTAAQEKLRPQGMATGFHNHQTEWQPVRRWQAADGRPGRRHAERRRAAARRRHVRRSGLRSRRLDQGQPRSHQERSPERLGQRRRPRLHRGVRRRRRRVEAAHAAAESTGGVEYYLIEQEHAGPDGEFAMAQRCLDNYKKLRG